MHKARKEIFIIFTLSILFCYWTQYLRTETVEKLTLVHFQRFLSMLAGPIAFRPVVRPTVVGVHGAALLVARKRGERAWDPIIFSKTHLNVLICSKSQALLPSPSTTGRQPERGPLICNKDGKLLGAFSLTDKPLFCWSVQISPRQVLNRAWGCGPMIPHFFKLANQKLGKEDTPNITKTA